MTGTRAAIRYAKAILSVATDNQSSDKIQLEIVKGDNAELDGAKAKYIPA